jgi:hypothetical protein
MTRSLPPTPDAGTVSENAPTIPHGTPQRVGSQVRDIRWARTRGQAAGELGRLVHLEIGAEVK